MRKIIILLSLCIMGCNSIKKSRDIKEVDNNNQELIIDTNIIDSDGDSVPDYIEERVYRLLSSSQGRKRPEQRYETKYETKYNIINLLDTNKLLDDEFAIMGYNVPSFFKVNQKATIKLRISKENTIESVIVGSRNIPIVGLSSSDNIILETIKVSDQMSVKLYTDKEYFLVELVNSGSTQNIEKEGYTEWVWRVTPLKSGNSYIKMIITMAGKDIVVYEKEIPVESNWSWSLSNWLIKWWQALTATIITPILIPFFIWLWKRKKRKSKE